MRRAKIVCTLGPATASPRRIRELVYAGMDVARLNMSHGSHEDHAESYRLVREASDASGHGVGIFADLQGPKIRLATFADGPVLLRRGQEWTITTRDVPGDVHAGVDELADPLGRVDGRAEGADDLGSTHAVHPSGCWIVQTGLARPRLDM